MNHVSANKELTSYIATLRKFYQKENPNNLSYRFKQEFLSPYYEFYFDIDSFRAEYEEFMKMLFPQYDIPFYYTVAFRHILLNHLNNQ